MKQRWIRRAAWFAAALAAPVGAAPYWVAWEGDDFPENEGWLREGNEADPIRTLVGGTMNLNSLASDRSEDFYRIYGIPGLNSGEEFVVQWRLRVNQVNWDNPNFPYDPGWAVNSHDGWRATFVLGQDELHNLLEQKDTPFDPGVFHEWEFRSPDMRSFTLYLNGVLASTGAFAFANLPPRMSWGDLVSGPTSNLDWDYFRFGVVPEPNTGIAALTVLVAHTSRRRRIGRLG